MDNPAKKQGENHKPLDHTRKMARIPVRCRPHFSGMPIQRAHVDLMTASGQKQPFEMILAPKADEDFIPAVGAPRRHRPQAEMMPV